MHVVRLIWAATLFLLMGLSVARSEMRPSAPRDRAEIRQVVEAQLKAWREGDQVRAYALAASGLRARYPLPAFVELVRRGYPEIAYNTRAELGSVVDDGSSAMVSVRVFGAGGRGVRYRYLLVREDQGWRISGVIGEVRPINEV